MIKEEFLHYVWRLKLFSTTGLCTVDRRRLTVLLPGQYNEDAGPDFFNAKVCIANQLWVGTIEMHVKSSDWFVHGHEKDPNYDNVILHVVWEHDMEIYRVDQQVIPTLLLPPFIPKILLTNYSDLVGATHRWIPCQKSLPNLSTTRVNPWLERLYIERLEEKTRRMEIRLKQLNNDWEAVLFESLARNFGLKVNADAFENLAQQINFNQLKKLRPKQMRLEALLFGQAGFLDQPVECGYKSQLLEEFKFLTSKYKLVQPTARIPFQFFRLRPANFPTLRLAQLAALIYKEAHLFSKLMETQNLNDFRKLFKIQLPLFWQTHYSFTASAKKSPRQLSATFVYLLIVNTVIPLKFIYLKSQGNFNPAPLLDTLAQLPPEKNSIVQKFANLGLLASNALQSQGLLQLKNNYCEAKKCLNCAIGNSLITLNKGGRNDF